MMKRAAITGITRDKEYNLTKNNDRSRILYFTANPNGEAEVIKVFLKPKPRLKNLNFEMDFSELAIKGRDSIGNILTRHSVHKIVMKEEGVSTLGGRKIWFDEDVLRLNADGRGKFLGEFTGDDKLLIVTRSGSFRICSYSLENHFEDDHCLIEKFKQKKIFSAVYFDAELNYHYVKRFSIDPLEKLTSFIGENPESRLINLSVVEYPRFEIKFGGKNKDRENEIIEVAEFIGIKSYKAKGKRMTSYQVEKINEIESIIKDEPEDEAPDDVAEQETSDQPKNDQPKSDDKDTPQMTLDL